MFPNEISNHICSYIEGSTNKIIKDICYWNVLDLLRINKKYKYTHININRLLNVINIRCPNCINRLTPEEYLYKGYFEITQLKKLCFDCETHEKCRIIFECSQSILLIIIFIIVWLSFITFLNNFT